MMSLSMRILRCISACCRATDSARVAEILPSPSRPWRSASRLAMYICETDRHRTVTRTTPMVAMVSLV